MNEGDLILIGWYCWRCRRINDMACRSDCVPIYVPPEWAEDVKPEIVRET